MRELLARTAHELLADVSSGEIDHNELQEAQYAFAREIDGELNNFTAWDEVVESQGWDLDLSPDRMQTFSHMPFAAKDLFATKGLSTTSGSNILKGYEPSFDASIVAHLRQEKNHLMGKTNMDEFAMGSSGENSAYGPSRNPWDLARVAGGSSSGSASAVAACQSFMALGTDTGGSIRIPASFCGVVGYRPTYGLLSRYGMVAYSSSCDQAGTFTRCTLDAALAMNTMSHPDPLDSTCRVTERIDYYADARKPIHWNKLRVGVISQFMDPERVDNAVLANCQRSIDILREAGAEIIELDFSIAQYCIPAYYVITAAECSSNLARYDGVRFGDEPQGDDLLERYLDVRSRGFGEEVKRRILLGTYVLSSGYFDAYYNRARAMRGEIARTMSEMFRKVDVIVCPTSPNVAFGIGEKADDPVAMYMSDLFTVFVNLAGLCGVSMPNGFADSDGSSLPTSIQFVCPGFHDSLLLRICSQFEELSAWRFTPPAWITEKLGA
ncbi:MAG: Asp-tRNA(Asn)/Glu-tRNA(Gln) amidotransferase subunit GatA [Planctomycetales bacterium]|nr:Asp-tRNA(Asn)/Glu-tRNA(Gln) amidotransferase subunit GatA [bacterium]UNM07642.1 MAG: Asp-tRNA(Asn)/Glu-tRNA(Gln) amidotransferase subunit GatA [Planctomycetales bacterium]